VTKWSGAGGSYLVTWKAEIGRIMV
jgi:hypothetical protein